MKNKIKPLMKRGWTITEIDFLKNEYLSGTPIKKIASILDRTESSAGKMLERLKVARTRKKKIDKLPSARKRPRIKKADDLERDYNLEHYTEITEMVDWFNQHALADDQLTTPNGYEFYHRGQILSVPSLALLCNRKRFSMSLNIFLLETID